MRVGCCVDIEESIHLPFCLGLVRVAARSLIRRLELARKVVKRSGRSVRVRWICVERIVVRCFVVGGGLVVLCCVPGVGVVIAVNSGVVAAYCAVF